MAKKTRTWLESQESVQAQYEAEGLTEAQASALARESMLYAICSVEAQMILSASLPKNKPVDQRALVALAMAIRAGMDRGAQ